MLFENFFEDSFGKERTAGTMETSVSELVTAIKESPIINDVERCLIWNEKLGMLEMFFGNHTCIHMVFETPEEKVLFISNFPTVRLFTF